MAIKVEKGSSKEDEIDCLRAKESKIHEDDTRLVQFRSHGNHQCLDSWNEDDCLLS
jgi:hypothetical protein